MYYVGGANQYRYRPFLSKYIHIVYCKCMQRSCIYLFIFSRTCVHILAVRHNTIDFFITFPSLFIKKNGQRCLQYNSYFTYSYIFIYVFVYWYHLYDCVYHEINNYFIKLKQFFLFDKEYSTCTMVWKNRTRHNTTCLLFGWRYFFLLGEKYLTSGVYVSRISR